LNSMLSLTMPRSNCGKEKFKLNWKMARNTSTLSICYVYKKN
jgi:hypothetical protein